MAIANDILFLALRNAGVNGVGQTPLAEDINDGLVVLNAMIGEWNLERKVQANPVVCPVFPNLTSNVAFWDPYIHLLLTAMSVRLRQIYNMAPAELDVQIAAAAIKAFQAINAQQIAPLLPGTPTTVLGVIYLALRMAGRITDDQLVTAASKDVDDAFQLFVGMVAQWQKKRFLVYVQQEVSVPASTGAQYYTIGPGQDFDCARPSHIAAAYVRIIPGVPPNLVDIPVNILVSREEYANISVKTIETMPAYVFFDTGWPVGRLYWWPVPPANMYGLYITVVTQLPTYTNVGDALNLPPEYQEAMVSNLACRIAAASGQTPNPYVLAMSNAALAALRAANAQIPEMTVPVPHGYRGSDISLVGPGFGRAFVVGQDVVLG